MSISQMRYQRPERVETDGNLRKDQSGQSAAVDLGSTPLCSWGWRGSKGRPASCLKKLNLERTAGPSDPADLNLM